MLHNSTMNEQKEPIEVDVSADIGYHPVNISDQICGKIFPDSKVKPGTRWIYIILLIIVLGVIIFETVEAISLLLK